MKYRKFGNVNRDGSIIGQGTWYIDEADRVDAVAALRRGLDLGMNHIDTAEMCGAGIAETIVAEAITGRRGEVFLVSKVLPQNASPSGTRLACERSLRHLRTDRLDCYLLHSRGPQPLEATFEAFENLRQAGNILSWGVSNFDIGDLEDAVAIAGEGRVACDQVLHHVQERTVESTVIPWWEWHGLAVTAYSAIGHGDFPGPTSIGGRVLADVASYARCDRPPGRARISHAVVECLCDPESFQARTRRRERRRRRSAPLATRDRAPRSAIPAKTRAARASGPLAPVGNDTGL
jgi:diketogulonate reductase-like aldo/keto reductase